MQASHSKVPNAALSRRCVGYGSLSWVNDVQWFSSVLPEHVLVGAPGVLDLGCGPARLGRWLANRSETAYLGIDTSPRMLDQVNPPEPAHRPLSVIVGDIETLTMPSFAGWVFVIANVLHYLRDPVALRDLPRRFGPPRVVCVAQTESRDARTLAWAQDLFDIVWPGYSRRWYKAGDLDRFVERLGARVIGDDVLEQPVDMDAWLAGWSLSSTAERRAQRHFDQADDIIKHPSTFREGANRVMVRRQRIMHLLMSQASPA